MKYIALDLETSPINEITGHREVEILGYGLASVNFSNALQWSEIAKSQLIMLNEQAKNGKLMWVFHNGSFDIPVLRRHGVDIQPGTYHDTQILSWCLDPTHERYSLDACCHRYQIPGKFEKPESWEAWTDYMADYCEQDCNSTVRLFHEVQAQLQQDTKGWKLYETVELPYIECIIEFEDTGFLIDHEKLSSLIDELEVKRAQYLASVLSWAAPVPDKLKLVDGNFVPDPDRCEKHYPKATQHPLTGPMVKQLCYEKIPNDKEQEYTDYDWIVTKRNTKTIVVAKDQWVYEPGVSDEAQSTQYVGHNRGVWPHCKLREFNPNSGQQLAYLLHKNIGWEPTKLTKTGQPKTDEEALGWMRDEHPFIDAYLNLTEVSKLLDSFLYKFDHLKDEDHILRGSFNHTGTCTGRLSASEPNWQNVPSRGSYGHLIRSLIIAPEQEDIVGIDLSNIEGRVLAHYLSLVMGDSSMADIFDQGLDFHSMNVINWGLAPGYTYEQVRDKVDDVVKAARNSAKTLLYASLYGAGPEKVGQGDKQKGIALLRTLEENAPSMVQLKELVWRTCTERGGLIHDAFGRRLVYRNMVWSHALSEAKEMIAEDVDNKLFSHQPNKIARMLQARAKRQVFNSLLQGTAASVLKVITLEVFKQRDKLGLRTRFAAPVHDELQMYSPKEETLTLEQMLEEEFARPLLSHCCIMGEAEHGRSWGDTH